MPGKNPDKLYNKNFNLLISEQRDYSISGLFAGLCLFFFFSCVLSEEEKVAPHSYQLGAILALMTERRSPEERKQFHTFIWDCDTVRQT